jgi:trehalose 6-phosphate synthase
MEPAERQARMRRMRHFIREHNVYRWAATLIGDLADMRGDGPAQVPAATR